MLEGKVLSKGEEEECHLILDKVTDAWMDRFSVERGGCTSCSIFPAGY
jgi:hypothetical protein